MEVFKWKYLNGTTWYAFEPRKVCLILFQWKQKFFLVSFFILKYANCILNVLFSDNRYVTSKIEVAKQNIFVYFNWICFYSKCAIWSSDYWCDCKEFFKSVESINLCTVKNILTALQYLVPFSTKIYPPGFFIFRL